MFAEMPRFISCCQQLVSKWVILGNWALNCDMETKSEYLPNNSQNPYSYEGLRVIHMTELKIIFILPFDLEVTHIEQCGFHVRQVMLKRTSHFSGNLGGETVSTLDLEWQEMLVRILL